MFDATRIDKIRRSVKKYQDGELSNQKIVASIRKPLYCCIVLLLIILAFCIYFALCLTGTSSINNNVIYSEHVMKLKNRFIEQLKLSRKHPKETTKDKILIPENNLFTRTKSIQYLYDYVEAATKQIYIEEYLTNPNYHHIECIETFTPRMRRYLKDFEIAVKQFVDNKESIYRQSIIESYTRKSKITKENNGGLNELEGQFGVFATKNIKKNTCIGHYYGDEYLLKEYEAQFPWNIYGVKENHPFRKKWDYYMTIPYHTFGDKKLKLPLNVTLTMDSYHRYNYKKYVNEGGQDLNEKESKLKWNMEPLINDPRTSLYKSSMTAKDLKRKNCEYIYCSVDGVLLTFLIVTKDIIENEQLFVYYGPNYG